MRSHLEFQLVFSFLAHLGDRNDKKLSSLFLIFKKTCILIYKKYLLIHDKKQVGIEIRFYILDTFKKQVDANCIDLDSEFVDLNYKVASLIFCHFWCSIDWSRERINYLDVKVINNSGRAETNLHIKPTDTYQYLYHTPCHPRICKESIP